ncbi:tRNA pseudouridine(13) synthase TruD [Psychrobacter aestuarii]|uniref:tRNA pseudouridine synthase D n=1 Tax=Psychrobacter aestuarii TaxID=556327 RepID=A0ABP3FBW8_9GAMM|nr:tRNA pseudouridine(13) synthase TruD [Psychrobacter aestuarii]
MSSTAPTDTPAADSFSAEHIASMSDPSALPQPQDAPIKSARYKAAPTDFVVHEVMDIDFTEDGEHLWLHVQKVGMNTAFVAQLLSEWAQIPLRDVGYSGLKDRHALTTQWFSLRLPKKTAPSTPFAPTDLNEGESVSILAEHWHNKKLSRGAHRANRFVITLRDMDTDIAGADTAAVDSHLSHIAKVGVPNYFGVQRFGHHGNNVRDALNFLARPPRPAKASKGKKRRQAPRERDTLLLSAARSVIFNHILAARVRDNSWDTGLDGEVFNLAGSGSIFASEQMDETLAERVRTFDIHPTAPLWGTHNDKVSGTAAALEQAVIQDTPLLTALAVGLERHEIKAQRRALRLPIEDLNWQWLDNNGLQLDFILPTGSFATSVLASLVATLHS